jgi:hypothetical protein
MTAHRVVLVIGSVLVLLPVTVVAFLGGGYMLLIMLGQELFRTPVLALGISATTVTGLVGLVALWVLMAQAFGRIGWLADSAERWTLRLAHLGAGLAALGLLSLALTMVFPVSGEGYLAHLRLYAFGAPALLPYAHFLFLRKR